MVETSAPVGEERVERVQKLFGGKHTLGLHVRTRLDAHELLDKGLNARALSHFVGKLHYVKRDAFLYVIGMSERTYQRHKETRAKAVGRDQSGRAWKFAEVLTDATAIFGSQEEAERWLESPVLGLNDQRPIDLLTTPAGAELVVDFLTRVKYGVYT